MKLDKISVTETLNKAESLLNKEAYLLLERFDEKAKSELLAEKVLNADETGINVNKKHSGYILFQANYGLIFILMKNVALMPWMKWGFYLTLQAH